MNNLQKQRPSEPIAIIGIGCRFPGSAHNPEAFWSLLSNGVDAIVDVPPNRWDLSRFYDPNPEKPGKMYVRQGGFLHEPVDGFDAQFFGISPREAAGLDPQQRLLLEITWEAMEDAGVPWETLKGSETGVYIGGFTLDSKILQLNMLNRHLIDAHTSTSATMTMLANRISYTFDFRGPSLTLDTACSASLVAFHYACQDIWNGRCPVAMAGGVNIMLRPEYSITMSKGHFLSPDGRCKAFDARANGYVRGEGAGVVMLKPLSQAQADGDRIYALVRGAGINQDGNTPGITLPNKDAQIALMRRVYRQTDVAPERIQYIEAHGTGTQAGDTIEAAALGAVVAPARSKDRPCLIGSVKTNIGHLEAAAGIAGLIKTALALSHREIPPNLHFETPNPDIPFDAYRLRIPQALEPWPDTDAPLLAGVNSFGYGGTNAHVLLEGADPVAPAMGHTQDEAPDRITVLPLSARSDEGLKATAQAYLAFLSSDANADTPVRLQDMAHSLTARRSAHTHRLAIITDSQNELKDHLQWFVADQPSPGIVTGRATPGQDQRLVFVYTGMGPQWWAMGRTLLETEPLFRQAVAQCDDVFRTYAGWSLVDAMLADEDASRMAEPEVAQTTNFALQVGLTALWGAWGVNPVAVIGHSVGEVAAAYTAGILSLEDAVKVSYHRSRVQQMVNGQGRMLATGLSEHQAEDLLAGLEGMVSVAGLNSRNSVVLSGDPVALEEIAGHLESKDIYNRFLYVEVAYHSYQMDPLKDDLMASLEELAPKTPGMPIYSTVTGRRVGDERYDAAYWWKNVRQPVRFSDALDALIEYGYRSFIEIGPHPALSTYIRDGLSARKLDGRLFASLNRKKPDTVALSETVSGLYCTGYPIDWNRFTGDKDGAYIKLPTYPWQRETYFFESGASRDERLGASIYPLLGKKLRVAGDIREIEINHTAHGYLKDHAIEGAVVFPGAAYIEAGLSLDHALSERLPSVLESISFHKALIIDERDICLLHVAWNPDTRTFGIYSSHDGEHDAWTLHAEGRLLQGIVRETHPRLDLDVVRARCAEYIDAETLYALLHESGLEYGPMFQAVKHVSRCPGEALIEIQAHETILKDIDRYRLHPTVLDAGFQALIAAHDPDDTASGVYMPVEIERIEFYGAPGQACMGYGRLTAQTPDSITGDVTLCDDSGQVYAAIRGLRCRALPSTRRKETAAHDGWLYAFQWQEAALPSSSGFDGTWLIFDDASSSGAPIKDALEADGARCIRILQGDTLTAIDPSHFEISPSDPGDFLELMDTLDHEHLRGAIYLWNLTGSPDDPAMDQGVRDCMAVTYMTQALAGRVQAFRLALVTRSAQRVTETDELRAVGQSSLWGLGRVIMNEHPELGCLLLDLDEDLAGVANLLSALSQNSTEEEIGIRRGIAYVRRLIRPEMEAIADSTQKLILPEEEVAFDLHIGQPGILDSLYFRETERQRPGPGEIEVRVHSIALNFKDIMKAMGMLSDVVLSDTFFGNTLGMECSGTVVAVGEDVDDYREGQEVIVLTGQGCFRSYITVSINEACIVPKPETLSMEEAPVIVPYLTAYYALHDVARLERGERVLIHAATGGVGLAAVHHAQAVGAEIFATAGSPEKRRYLERLGIRYIMDSRSLAFADEIMAWTDGEGVDVALNSLSGEALTKSFSVLAPYGRFIEIGKRDIDENNGLPMRPFNRNLTFAAVDLDRMLKDRRGFMVRLLHEVCAKLSDESLGRLPVRAFPASEVADAFRFVAQARHMGKVVVTLYEQPVSVTPLKDPRSAVRADGAYLITGGYGGFGLETAKRLVDQGARHLVLAGRHGVLSPEARVSVEALKTDGVDIHMVTTDVSRYDQVEALISDITTTMPPLRGVVHAAGALADERLVELDREAFEKAMAPKAAGAWHLHCATREIPLDFFILFSSVSAIVGNTGQGNYAAANAFLDGLAYHRRTLGLPATSINWGALTQVGMAARHPDVLAHLERMGLHGFSPDRALDVLQNVLDKNPVQIGIMDMDWQQWSRANPVCARSPRFSHCISVSEHNGHAHALLHTLGHLDEEVRVERLRDLVHEQIARVLRLPVSRLDINTPLMDQGMDSLLAVELLTSIQVSLGIELSQMDLMKGASVAQLAEEIHSRLDVQIKQIIEDDTSHDMNAGMPGKVDVLMDTLSVKDA